MDTRLLKKIEKVRNDMRKHHPEYSHDGLLNIGFRYGDVAHSQFSDYEERIILPLLVKQKKKKVASLCSRFIKNLQHIKIPIECKSVIVKNRWNMYCLIIYHVDDDELTPDKIIGLVNETLPLYEIGYLYGYR